MPPGVSKKLPRVDAAYQRPPLIPYWADPVPPWVFHLSDAYEKPLMQAYMDIARLRLQQQQDFIKISQKYLDKLGEAMKKGGM